MSGSTYGRVLLALATGVAGSGCVATISASSCQSADDCWVGEGCVGGVCGVLPPCTGGETGTCGRCGTRICAADGVWDDCSEEGPCAPGESTACAASGTMTCGENCQWSLCSAGCLPGEGAACGNCGTMLCGDDGRWGACESAGPCLPGATSDCTGCSSRTCGESCQWGACISECEVGAQTLCRNGACVPCGALNTQCCNGECGAGLVCGGADGKSCVACGAPGSPCCSEAPRCNAGFICGGLDEESCLPAPDAGRPDAGGVDAGRPDAGGVDAGRPDAGGVDAGRPDAGGVDAGPPDAGATVPFAARTAPLVLYYGQMKGNLPDGGTLFRTDLSFQFYDRDLDVVVTTPNNSFKDKDGASSTVVRQRYRDHGLRIAFHMGITEVVACLEKALPDTVFRKNETTKAFTDAVRNPCPMGAGRSGAGDLAAYWKSQLDGGYDYIAIDEIKKVTLKLADRKAWTCTFTNGALAGEKTLKNPFVSALTTLAASGAAYDKSVILFFVPHDGNHLVASTMIPKYSGLLSACADHCRMVMHELYLTTTEVLGGHAAIFNTTATALGALSKQVGKSLNRSNTVILAVGNETARDVPPGEFFWGPFDRAACDLTPFNNDRGVRMECPATGWANSGGLVGQLRAIRKGSASRYWRGVGFYKVGAMGDTRAYTKEEFRRVTHWYLHQYWGPGNPFD